MRLTILGSSGVYPVPGNPASGFLLTVGQGRDARRLWIDAGNGTFAALQRHADFAALDALVLSHTHADHCLDVIPFYYARRFHADAPLPRLPLLCPPGSRELLAPIVREEGGDKLGEVFDFREIRGGGTAEVAGLTLRFAWTDHPVPTVALRAESGGHSLAYTADTGPGPELADVEELARGADLLVAEATYQEGQAGAPVHLSATQAGRLARDAGVRRLLLTHVWPELDPAVSVAEARRAAGERVEVAWAEPGTTHAVEASAIR